MSARVSTGDLWQAAEWLNAYEAEDGDGDRDRNPDGTAVPYEGTDDVAAAIYRVADMLVEQARKREAEAAERARVRQVQDTVEAKTGRRPSAATARATLRRFAALQEG